MQITHFCKQFLLIQHCIFLYPKSMAPSSSLSKDESAKLFLKKQQQHTTVFGSKLPNYTTKLYQKHIAFKDQAQGMYSA